MDAGIWAAQAVVHSSGPGVCQAWAYRSQANRYRGKSSYRAGWLQGPKEEEAWGCRKHPVFYIRRLAFRFRRQREKKALVQTRVPEAAGSDCLKEKLFCGAHCRVGRLVREVVPMKSPAWGSRPSGRLRSSGP